MAKIQINYSGILVRKTDTPLRRTPMGWTFAAKFFSRFPFKKNPLTITIFWFKILPKKKFFWKKNSSKKKFFWKKNSFGKKILLEKEGFPTVAPVSVTMFFLLFRLFPHADGGYFSRVARSRRHGHGHGAAVLVTEIEARKAARHFHRWAGRRQRRRRRNGHDGLENGGRHPVQGLRRGRGGNLATVALLGDLNLQVGIGGDLGRSAGPFTPKQ